MSDDYVIHEYLEQESIPLLLEIPFKKEIAELYSKGSLFIKTFPEWEIEFLKLFSEINQKYGNCNYKW
jgi:MinD superfamily P-loop ATPase